MLWKGQPWLVLGNRGELLSAFWKAGAMLERGWREPLMGLAEKQLLMRRISVNFEVSHARISTIVVTSRMNRAEMTHVVRKEACVWGQDSPRKQWKRRMRNFWLLVCLALEKLQESSHFIEWLIPWVELQGQLLYFHGGWNLSFVDGPVGSSTHALCP